MAEGHVQNCPGDADRFAKYLIDLDGVATGS